MAKINLLDKTVYNRISAGEVVENPASVVKELVENSIDAGADFITVSIENGGIKSISVTDNGCGMEKEDLGLSILPHATSKISDAADLNTVSTLGFRGEALASIAAVSEFTLKSKYFESDVAYYLEVKGGEVVGEGVCAMNCGTSVTVKSLFYNTPARYKFLKNAKGEENSVTSLMAELIFANTDISFDYSVDGKTVYRTDGSGLEEALYAVYGANIAGEMLPVEISDKKIRINGFTAKPASEAVKNTRKFQTFVINGRVISEPTFSAVIQNAYGEKLMKRTFPTVVLDIIMPFDEVDVNVHPNKREVRFANPSVINGLVYHAIKATLEKYENATSENFNRLFGLSIDKSATDRSVDYVAARDNSITATSAIGETAEKNEEPDSASVFKYLFNFRKKTDDVTNGQNGFSSEKVSKTDTEEEKGNSFAGSTYQNINSQQRNVLVFNDPMREKSFYEKTNLDEGNYKIVGQAFNTYLLMEIGDELYFIDQHAAHERIIFDKLIAESESNVTVQDLMIPFSYQTDETSIEFLKSIKDDFAKFGFILDFTDDYVYLKSIPSFIENMDFNLFLSEIILYNKKINGFTSTETVKDIIARTACRRAIKGGAALSDEEIKTLIDYFLTNGVPLQCPHGRPTMIKITKNEIEKMFGRKI